jgi:hypothetical protein
MTNVSLMLLNECRFPELFRQGAITEFSGAGSPLTASLENHTYPVNQR